MDNLMVIIAAAGTGSRMQSNINKQYMLLNNRPVLYYAVQTFSQISQVKEIVIVAHPDEVEYCSEYVVKRYEFTKVTEVIAGGETRQDSVVLGLQALQANLPYVAIHDGARPLVRPESILEVFSEAIVNGAAILGTFATNTMKLVDEDNYVFETLDRSKLVAVQTPQIFDYAKLIKAYELAKRDNFVGTDDASIYEKYIGKVKVVIGDNTNIKITNPEDISIAEQLLVNSMRERK